MFSKRIVIKENTKYIQVEKKQRFKDRVVLVTGGSGSIGKATALRFLNEGATVVLAGRSLDKLLETKDELNRISGADADTVVMDITDSEQIKTGIDGIVKKHKKLDILVNNAGYSGRDAKKNLINQEPDKIDELLNTNLTGAILCAKYALPYMTENKYGRIINVGSIVGSVGGKAKHVEYAAAKAGIVGFTRSLAIECGKDGVTVNTVSPGLVPREDASEEKLANFSEMNYIGRICRPEDIANAIVFLASDEADYITGINLPVDGGRSLVLKGDN